MEKEEQLLRLYHSEKKADQRIITTLEKKLFDLRNLIEIGMSLSANLDFKNLVELILYTCIGQMLVEKVAILLPNDIDDKSYTIHTSKGYDTDLANGDVILNENSELVRFLEKKNEVHEYSILIETKTLHEDMIKIDPLEPELIIPVRYKNYINGILIIGAKINGGGFSSEDKIFLKELSRFAAIAVENSRLYLMATMDRMTKLFIHHYFQERLLEEMVRAKRYGTKLSLIMSDIDHFKKFNDTYGHQQGDIVLKEAAKIFKDSVRTIDIAARYGGEEFAIILPETDLEGAMQVANRLRKSVEEHEFPGQENPLHVTISLGVAEYNPEKDLEKSHFIGRSDKALYKAKESGRNRVAGSR